MKNPIKKIMENYEMNIINFKKYQKLLNKFAEHDIPEIWKKLPLDRQQEV